MNDKYMMIALKEAKKAYDIGEVPVGAVIVKNNVVLSKAYNKKETTKNLIKHAEIIAIEKACKKNKDWRLDDCILYTTLFPCPMCASAIQQSRIKQIVYIDDTNNQYIKNNTTNILNSNNSNHRVDIIKMNFEKTLLNDFFKKIRLKWYVSRETFFNRNGILLKKYFPGNIFLFEFISREIFFDMFHVKHRQMIAFMPKKV